MYEPDDTDDYLVVVNDEEQYSIWLATLEVPAGWRPVHGPAPRQACLDYVDEVWTDMRPLSLRRLMDGEAGSSPD